MEDGMGRAIGEVEVGGLELRSRGAKRDRRSFSATLSARAPPRLG